MSRVVLVSDSAVIGMEIDTSKFRIDPVGNVRDLFLLERIFSGLVVMLVDQLGLRGEGVFDLSG